ncbi:hypothetical protein HOP50_17g79710 [Chloropicon primus]|nr:hypothetical protein HOP50_17g79710 [Chloropicon primus]
MGVGKKGKQQKKGAKKGGGGGNVQKKRNGGGAEDNSGDGSHHHESQNGGGGNSHQLLLGTDVNSAGPGGGQHDANGGNNAVSNLDPHGRVERVMEFWKSLGLEERRKMLSVPLNDLLRELNAAAAQEVGRREASSAVSTAGDASEAVDDGGEVDLTAPSHLKGELERGLGRLKRQGTWKAWIPWDALKPREESSAEPAATPASATSSGKVEFHDGERFKQYLQACYPKELYDMLMERDWNSKMEFEAETELRLRMHKLLNEVNSNNFQLNSPQVGGGNKGDPPANRTLADNGKDSAEGAKSQGADREALREREQLNDMNSSRRMKLSKRYASRNDHLSNIRNNQVELITMMLGALQHEHELLYHAFLFPVTDFVCDKLEPDNRASSKEELFFEDLDSLTLEDVSKISEFLTEKIDGLSSRLKPGDGEEDGEPQDGEPSGGKDGRGIQGENEDEDEEEGMGDVDLFQLEDAASSESEAGDKAGAGAMLVVNPKWLNHLEERCLSEDGHPMKVSGAENEHKVGLVLDWVYGSIVSTAEKSRAAAGIQLGQQPVGIEELYNAFIQGLTEQYELEQKKKKAKWYLEEMVKSRKLNQELTEQLMEIQQASEDLEAGNKMVSVEPEDGSVTNFVPDQVIYEMLKREGLLTEAKLYSLAHEHENCEKRLRNVRAQLRQTEPEFERLKNELEELKANPRGTISGANPGEGSYRNQAEMERHRAQLQDAAIEEQIEVQSAFREQGVHLKMLFGKRQEFEVEMAQKDSEMKQLTGWKRTIDNMAGNFKQILENRRELKEQAEDERKSGTDGDKAKDPKASSLEGSDKNGGKLRQAPASSDLTENGGGDDDSKMREKCRSYFHKDIRRQLYTEKEDRFFFKWINDVLKELEKRIDAGCAALSHMETNIVNLACDDPGALIGGNLLLPRHQRTIDLGAEDHMQRKAKEAEDEILRLEVEAELKRSQDREKKQKKRNKQKEEKRLQRERLKEESEKRERELKDLELKREKEKEEKEEKERREKERLREMRRKMEEEVIERRRAELMGDFLPSAEEADLQTHGGFQVEAEVKSAGNSDDDGFTVVTSTKRRSKKEKEPKRGGNGAGKKDKSKEGGKKKSKGGKASAPAVVKEKEQRPPQLSMNSEEWPSPATAQQQQPALVSNSSQTTEEPASESGVVDEPPKTSGAESPPDAVPNAVPGGAPLMPRQMMMGGVPPVMQPGVNMMAPPPPVGVNGMPMFIPPAPGTMGVPAMGMQPPHGVGMPMPPPYFPGPMQMNYFMPQGPQVVPQVMPPTAQRPAPPTPHELSVLAQPFQPVKAKETEEDVKKEEEAKQDEASPPEMESREEPCPCGLQSGPCGM